MNFKKVRCQKCGAGFEVEEARTSYSCPNCTAVHIGGQIQQPQPAKEREALIDGSSETPPSSVQNEAPHDEFDRLAEADQYKLQAEFILHALQANLQVYGSNSAWNGAQPADVDLALRYINRSLEYFPDNPAYLNLKALLLIEGLGQREQGLALLKRAHELNPRDITIEDNLKKLESSPACFVATAAYGSCDEWQVRALRRWRDDALIPNRIGSIAVLLYYRFSPPAARIIAESSMLRAFVRACLFPLTRRLADRYRRPD